VAYLGSSIDKKVLASVLSVDSQLKSLIAAVLALLFGIFADLFGVGWSIVIVSTALFLLTPLLKLREKKAE
jgi:putative exporter of polyketide antibiotics